MIAMVEGWAMGTAEVRVAREARRAGLFLLRSGGSWEFLSGTTGKRLLVWVASTGALLDAASKRVGRAKGPFGAMHRAIRIDRAATR